MTPNFESQIPNSIRDPIVKLAPIHPAFVLVLLAAAFPLPLHAGARSSASYAVATDVLDAGGGRATSASYTHNGSAGQIAAGIATVASPAETAKQGFLGQIYDIVGFMVTGVAPDIDETGILQLAAWDTLDDDSLLALDPNLVAWSVLGGPLTGVSAGGLATAGAVYQDTAATVQGMFGAFSDSVGLTVLDILPDNFGSYAGDGIDDDWQEFYFGLDNPLAGPGQNPDHDTDSNRFEFIAGLDPTDAGSRFLLDIQPVAGEPNKKKIIFSPRFTDRTYAVRRNGNLAPGGWAPFFSTTDDNGFERTVTDDFATAVAMYYRVEIIRP